MELIIAELPRRLEDVTTDWLTGAFAVNYPGTVVTSFRPDGEISGTASKLRLALDYNDAGAAHGLPPRAWLKGGFEGKAFGNAASFTAEARFFAEWAPLLPINLPRAFYCGADPSGEQGLVMIEDLDLRGATYGKSTAPLAAAQAARVLDVRAHVHAALWNSPKIANLRCYRDRFAGANHWVAKLTAPDAYRSWINTPRFVNVPKSLHDPQVYAKAMDALYGFTEQGPQAFNQGDSHLGNVFFEADGTPGILDWQAYIRCNPMVDIAYFLIGALTVEDRRRHERVLIAGYLDALARHGVAAPPSFEDAWIDYRRFALHGFSWALTTSNFHPEDVIQAYAERYGAAAGDLETLQVLGA